MTHDTIVRVRYAETDQMGVVYHANFFVWMEIGRVELLRSIGLVYKDIEARGFILPVIEAHCRYRRPARYDDVIKIQAGFHELQASRVKIEYKILHDKEAPELLAEGYTVHACVNLEGKPTRLPEDLYNLLRQLLPADTHDKSSS